MIKAKTWDGEDLQGEWLMTYKVDGVRAIIKDGVALSKGGKPLHNLQDIPDGDYEVLCGSWSETITAVRTHNSVPLTEADVVSLYPVDGCLSGSLVLNPCASYIEGVMSLAVDEGFEGLVLRQGDTWLKVKPYETYDVEVIGLKPGTKRNEGRLGAFITPMGNVNVHKDEDREQYKDLPLGTIIEVKCWELTKKGKFRHPRLVRVRYDK